VPVYDVPYAPTAPEDQGCATTQSTIAAPSRTSSAPYSICRAPNDAPLPRTSTSTSA